jgi:carbon starvation protein
MNGGSPLGLHAGYWMLFALGVLAVAYRYYSAFLAAKVLVLDDARVTPAHTLADGHNYHPTRRLVLFGHHFAAITGAGPLIGPVLAAQFGFLPGYSWILFGVVLGGAVHDFVVLVASVRRGGRSLAEMAREELGPRRGAIAAVAILFIVVIALAGLGNVVVGALSESVWGVFTVGMTVPIALAMGFHIHVVRKDSPRGIQEATLVGCMLLFVALWAGHHVAEAPLGQHLRLSRTALTLAIAAYGFAASVLPVWVVLCPRDYLSSYLKLGTIALLVVGILVVRPELKMPAVTPFVHGGGPILKGPVFPFVFITIACGAISGFHALVASGTTPKMVSRESDCRSIGYGAMLLEGLVGITALIAACVMPPDDYVAINTDPPIAIVATADSRGHGLARSAEELERWGPALTARDRQLLGLAPDELPASLASARRPASRVLSLSNGALAALGYSVDPAGTRATGLDDGDFARLGIAVTELPALSRAAGEVVAARTGGGVSLAVGMARVFSGLPGMSTLLSYWYHFAIMFEALFILTTIDTGTRIGRFLVQEWLSRVTPRLGRSENVAGGVVASLAIVAGWTWFILTGSIQTIWPMFGIANQLLACVALAVATTVLLKEARRRRYALCTALPLAFLVITTVSAGVMSVWSIYVPMTLVPASRLTGAVNVTVTSALLIGIVVIVVGSARNWATLLRDAARPVRRVSQ